MRGQPQPFASGEAVAAYNRANDLVRPGDHVAARRQFDWAIALEPGNASASMGRCIAYRDLRDHDLRDHDHAMRDCNEAIRLAPNRAKNYLERGIIDC